MDRKIPLSICSEIALPFCGLVVDDHCSTWYQRSAGVAHGASEAHRCWLSGRASAERRARIRRLGARWGTRESRCSTSPRSSNNHRSRTKDDFSIVRILGIRTRRWTWPSAATKPMAMRRKRFRSIRLPQVPLKNPIRGFSPGSLNARIVLPS